MIPKCKPVPRWALNIPPIAPRTLSIPGYNMIAHGAWSKTPEYTNSRVPVSKPNISKDKDSNDWLRLDLNF